MPHPSWFPDASLGPADLEGRVWLPCPGPPLVSDLALLLALVLQPGLLSARGEWPWGWAQEGCPQPRPQEELCPSTLAPPGPQANPQAPLHAPDPPVCRAVFFTRHTLHVRTPGWDAQDMGLGSPPCSVSAHT